MGARLQAGIEGTLMLQDGREGARGLHWDRGSTAALGWDEKASGATGWNELRSSRLRWRARWFWAGVEGTHQLQMGQRKLGGSRLRSLMQPQVVKCGSRIQRTEGARQIQFFFFRNLVRMVEWVAMDPGAR